MEKRRKNYEKDDHVGNHVTQGGDRRAAERESCREREQKVTGGWRGESRRRRNLEMKMGDF